MDAALQLEGVTKRYGAFTAVDDLSFSARRGKILGFLGPNGAGKTSSIRMVLGLVAPTAGRINVLGAPTPVRCVSGSASCRKNAASIAG